MCDFDEMYTAPRWGYAGALDYYRRASSMVWLSRIRLPTLILTARDDPFVAIEPFVHASANAAVELNVVAHGGHMGFLGGDGQGGIRWAETRVVGWALRQFGDCHEASPRS